jgi:ribose 5-phosphate isomerase A
MARTAIGRRATALGGVPVVRVTKEGVPFITDNGNEILDVKGLRISDPGTLEAHINAWPGVVTVGLFAGRGADLCLLGTDTGVETITYPKR